MPDISSYTFTHKEILDLMIKASGLHEGRWMLQMNFAFTAGNFGPTDDTVLPGAIVAVNHLALAKAPDGAPGGLVADAAKVNPKPST